MRLNEINHVPQRDSGELAHVAAFPVTADSLRAFLRVRSKSKIESLSENAVFAPFHITVRQNGKTLFASWFEDAPFYRTFDGVMRQFPMAQTVEISLTTAVDLVDPNRWGQALVLENTGRVGFEVRLSSHAVHRLSPLEAIAGNITPEKWIRSLVDKYGSRTDELRARGAQLRVLRSRQFVVRLGKEPDVDELYRGNKLVPPEAANEDLLKDVIDRMGVWFMANLGSDGSIPYRFLPTPGVEASDDNPIRRFMATIALNRLAIARNDGSMLRAARRNLAFNFARFYREDGELGLIHWDGSVKLGAMALAALAIFESEARSSWTDQFDKLNRTIDTLWQNDGAYHTFYYPRSRNDNHNFYPGETLLLWASRLRERMDEKLLERALRSVEYYRNYFWSDPNPAFVPWHVQACLVLYKLTKREDLKDYIFAMSDWLIPHQQWGGDVAPDLWGRFFSPHRRDFGPAHAASTGVYMEGFSDAFLLAMETGDLERAQRYKLVLFRALRSIAQLQFQGRADAYYIGKLPRVLGGVRTETYNNEIRVDNIQHALMGMLKFKEALNIERMTGKAYADSITSRPVMQNG